MGKTEIPRHGDCCVAVPFDLRSWREIVLIVAAIGLAGCNGLPVQSGADDFSLTKCLEDNKQFNDSVVLVRLADPATDKNAPLQRDDTYALSLGGMQIQDRIGNSLERCLLSAAKFGSIYRGQGALTAVSDVVPGFLDKELRDSLERETARVERERVQTSGTESAIDDKLFAKVLRGLFDAVNEDLRATYKLSVAVQGYDFSKSAPVTFQTSLSQPQDNFSDPTTPVKGKMLIWRGTQVDAYHASIKIERASPISDKIQALINKQEESKAFASRLGSLFNSVVAALAPPLAGFAESLGQNLGAQLDSRINRELKAFTGLRTVLSDVQHDFVTHVPKSIVDSDATLYRTGREFDLVAVTKEHANARAAKLDDPKIARTIFHGSFQVEMIRAQVAEGGK